MIKTYPQVGGIWVSTTHRIPLLKTPSTELLGRYHRLRARPIPGLRRRIRQVCEHSDRSQSGNSPHLQLDRRPGWYTFSHLPRIATVDPRLFTALRTRLSCACSSTIHQLCHRVFLMTFWPSPNIAATSELVEWHPWLMLVTIAARSPDTGERPRDRTGQISLMS